jgi:hypothetical protein
MYFKDHPSRTLVLWLIHPCWHTGKMVIHLHPMLQSQAWELCLVLYGAMNEYRSNRILLMFVILESVKYIEEDGEDFLLCEICRITILCLQLLNGYRRHLIVRRMHLNSLLSSLIVMLAIESLSCS